MLDLCLETTQTMNSIECIRNNLLLYSFFVFLDAYVNYVVLMLLYHILLLLVCMNVLL